MPAFLPAMIGGMLADKAMDKLGVSDNVRDAISFATNPRGFIGGRIVGEIANRAMAPRDFEGGPNYDDETLANLEGLKKGGKVSSASKRADGCCKRGKTRGKMY